MSTIDFNSMEVTFDKVANELVCRIPLIPKGEAKLSSTGKTYLLNTSVARFQHEGETVTIRVNITIPNKEWSFKHERPEGADY